MRHIAPPRQVIVIAHRGARARAPEGTAAAIRRALACKADMVELDVQLTRDYRLVVFHDARLERTTNGRGALSRWRYQDLARLDAGSWFSPRFAGERVLLVSQALRLIPPPYRINLELKRTTHPDLLIRRLLRCVRWTRTLRRVVISSFSPALLARLHRAQPRLVLAVLCDRSPWRALRTAARLGCAAFHPHASLVSPALVTAAHASGLRVSAWTVNRVGEARRLLRLGVDGLFTDVPEILRAAVREGGA